MSPITCDLTKTKNVIWRFPFKVNDRVVITMPVDAQILHVDSRGDIGEASLWALVNPEAPTTEYKFRIFGTGHTHPALEFGYYLCTWQVGPAVWHMFYDQPKKG